MLQAGQRVDQLRLHVRRKAHRVAVDVDLVDVEALRFEKQLMAFPIGKAHHLVFERRTVAWPDSLNLAVVERRLRDRRADEIVHGGRGVDVVALDLIALDAIGQEREGNGRLIAELRLEA